MNTSNSNTEKKDKKENVEKAMFRVVDHVVIKDKTTGKQLINKRG
jgi:hypothetical protein